MIDKPSSQETHTIFRLFVLSVLIMMAISAYRPYHQILWFAHSISIMIGLPILIATHKKFPLTTLTYLLIGLYAMIMLIGAHYTYEQEPLFSYLQETFHLSRNYFDRVGHLFQGIVPTIIIREILIRKQVVRGRRWLAFITVSMVLAISAFYELGEWWFALLSGKRADISLGMQGDLWDTQWDMFMALIGSILSLSLLSDRHDRQIERLETMQDVHPTSL